MSPASGWRFITDWLQKNSYESQLEEYITRSNPQDVGDVDRLTKEFEMKNNRDGWYGSNSYKTN